MIAARDFFALIAKLLRPLDVFKLTVFFTTSLSLNRPHGG
jgi:hypothetical protein